MTREEFEKAYNKVFDAQGNVRACGRAPCIELIEICEKLQPGNNFGNKSNGKMETEKIKMLYEIGPIIPKW